MNVLKIYERFKKLPFGHRLFSKLLAKKIPYTGSIPFTVKSLKKGESEVLMPDQRSVRNHLKSVHAVALMNLGELSTGLSLSTRSGQDMIILKSFQMDFEKKARGNISSSSVCPPLDQDSSDFEIKVEAVLRDSEKDVVARAQAYWRVRRRK